MKVKAKAKAKDDAWLLLLSRVFGYAKYFAIDAWGGEQTWAVQSWDDARELDNKCPVF